MNATGVVVRNIERADPARISALARHGVATVHESRGRMGLMKTYIRPIWSGACIGGSAVTVLAHPGDNWMLHVAIEQVRPGDILVVGLTATPTGCSAICLLRRRWLAVALGW